MAPNKCGKQLPKIPYIYFMFDSDKGHTVIIIIIIIMSLFKEDDIFSNNTNLTYGPHYKTNKTNKIYTLCTVQNLKSCTLY